MGRECGFMLGRYLNGRIEILSNAEGIEEKYKTRYLCGRCEATQIFISEVNKHFASSAISNWYCEKAIPEEDRFYPDLILNHPEFDRFRQEFKEPEATELEHWQQKFFYIPFEKFYDMFDFDAAEKAHKQLIDKYLERIERNQVEIKELREVQRKAETRLAFDGFQEEIDKLKTENADLHEELKTIDDDDYDYNHYRLIKQYLEEIKQLVEEDPELIVIAYANE